MGTEDTRTVRRLKNTGAGTPYSIEEHVDLDVEASEAQARRWWGSGGTCALVVLNEKGEVDSTYERDWIDEARVPADWKHRVAKPKTDLLPPSNHPKTVEAPPKPPPTLGAPVVQEKRTGCPVCFQETTSAAQRTDSPSQALADHRCPTCGMPSREAPARVWQRYMGHTSKQ